MKKALCFPLFGFLCAAIAPAWAQNATAGSNDSRVSRGAPAEVSLARLLQLQPAQIERLDRIYSDFAAGQRSQAAKIAKLQALSGQKPLGQLSTPDVHPTTRREREIESAQREIALDWKATRLKARRVLPPVQRSQLDSLAVDPRFRLRRDHFYQMLLAPDADLTAPDSGALDEEARRNWLAARRLNGRENLNRAAGVGSYGVYGGYSYGGPQMGVYGGYQQGAVGVHAGIGLGGPSMGVSIGRVFGVGRR